MSITSDTVSRIQRILDEARDIERKAAESGEGFDGLAIAQGLGPLELIEVIEAIAIDLGIRAVADGELPTKGQEGSIHG